MCCLHRGTCCLLKHKNNTPPSGAVRYHLKFAYHEPWFWYHDIRTLGIGWLHDMAYMTQPG